MASRAATLVKPKPKTKAKPKAPAKDVVAKSLVSKTATAVRSSAAAPASKTAAPQVKASSSKTPVGKAPIAKAALAKPAGIKPSLTKPSLAKVAKPSALKSPSKGGAGSEPVVIVGAASFETAAPKPRRRSKGEIRTRIYWAVFNQALRRVAVFEFDQRGEAEKRAAKLAKASGEHHFIQKIKAIVQ